MIGFHFLRFPYPFISFVMCYSSLVDTLVDNICMCQWEQPNTTVTNRQISDNICHNRDLQTIRKRLEEVKLYRLRKLLLSDGGLDRGIYLRLDECELRSDAVRFVDQGLVICL